MGWRQPHTGKRRNWEGKFIQGKSCSLISQINLFFVFLSLPFSLLTLPPPSALLPPPPFSSSPPPPSFPSSTDSLYTIKVGQECFPKALKYPCQGNSLEEELCLISWKIKSIWWELLLFVLSSNPLPRRTHLRLTCQAHQAGGTRVVMAKSKRAVSHLAAVLNSA